MPREPKNKRPNPATKTDVMIEGIVASLRWLAETCKTAGLARYGDIIDRAFTECLQRYVADQRDQLATTYDETPDDRRHLN